MKPFIGILVNDCMKIILQIVALYALAVVMVIGPMWWIAKLLASSYATITGLPSDLVTSPNLWFAMVVLSIVLDMAKAGKSEFTNVLEKMIEPLVKWVVLVSAAGMIWLCANILAA